MKEAQPSPDSGRLAIKAKRIEKRRGNFTWNLVCCYAISRTPARRRKEASMTIPNGQFQRVFSGAPWEAKVGYCRALRAGDLIHVTGTAPVDPGGGVHAPGDAYRQTRRCFEIIESSLEELGVGLDAVVRTRMYVTDISRWEEYGRAHAELFAEHPPATTMVEVAALIDREMLIEIEADAVASKG